jgi:pyruvate/2-oxoglutarate dehydrogenase complex dihydrolipoamide dehydrogenase (E3) component
MAALSIEELPQAQPLDEHNRRLVEHLHPPDWANPEPAPRYNLVVIGAGPAGLVVAAGAAGLGAKVALVEKHLMGGDCLNVGCVPSKALIRCAKAAADVRRAGQFGVRVPGGVEVDFPAVMERMRRLRAGLSHHDSAERFRDLGVDVFLGAGRFSGRDTFEVGGKTLRFAKACVATGARAAALPIPGLAEAGHLTNETIFSLTELPRRLAVIGAGPIGCELAQTFARFGTRVTLLEVMPQILIREDRDAAQRIEKALVADAVDIRVSCNVRGLKTEGAEKVFDLETDGKAEGLRVDQILLGVGRAHNVEGLGLDAAGVEFDAKQGVHVNDRLQTSNPSIYAAGDICFPFKFTHTADAMARIVIQNALFFGRAKASALTIPWCTYTDPEIAHVGMYAADAEKRGIEVQTHTVEMATVDRAVLDGEEEGFLKVHVKKGTDKILGATLVARHAGDMISEITLAMVTGAGLGTLAKTIHPYPTQAEVMRKAGDAHSRTRLTPTVAKIFDLILRWRR